VNFAAICNSRGVLAMLLITPAEPKLTAPVDEE
jgi:hypothetical protein